METVRPDAPSSYIQYLPVIYQGDAETGAFIGNFLKIFEKLLAGINDGEPLEGIEEVIDRVYEFFDPDRTRSEFLNWLAGWMALILKEDWGDTAKRRLLKRIIPLYRLRGTQRGLSEYLKIFVGPEVEVDDYLQGITVGDAGTIGVDTFVGGLRPHCFIVTITFPTITGIGFVQKTVEGTKGILDLEKPAHTFYALRYVFPGIIVGEKTKSTVGENTIIGSNYPIFV